MLLGLVAFVLAAAGTGCNNEEALLLLIRPPAGGAISQYEVTVQDRENRQVVYRSGIQSLPPSAKNRDLSGEPLKIGLKLGKTNGTYLVQDAAWLILVEKEPASRSGEALGNKALRREVPAGQVRMDRV